MFNRVLGLRPMLLLPAIVFTLAGCQRADQELTMELERSFHNFVHAIDERNEEGLQASVYFPKVSDYRGHVTNLLQNYLETLQKDKIVEFDPQGVVLSRFLGLAHHRHEVLSVSKSEDGSTAKMRISVHFAYDNNIRFSDYEKGTRVMVPAEPWGMIHVITVGGENPAPREQLKYLEIDIDFRKTNYEGLWQVRTCEVDRASIEYETSYVYDF